ncbi:hypothetical protein [uncultured Ruegeria sp.]|uniref:hypothetical protein n=1 Tax=uncultured Ruegeria sp. TaxID=259304 RepID=UPI00260DC72D|nr:hypothetical protein [uncultured Ruegeria sp.]
MCNQFGNLRLKLIALARQGFEKKHQARPGSQHLLQQGGLCQASIGVAKTTLRIRVMAMLMVGS